MKKRTLGKRRRPQKKDDDSCRFLKVVSRDTAGRPLPLNVHPGELLWEQFMKPLRLTPTAMAKAIPRNPEYQTLSIAEQIRELLRADEDSFLDISLALALDRYFGLRPGFFWRVQAAHEIREWQYRERDWLARIMPLKRP